MKWLFLDGFQKLQALSAYVFVTEVYKVVSGIAENTVLSDLGDYYFIVLCFKGNFISAVDSELAAHIAGNNYSAELVGGTYNFI